MKPENLTDAIGAVSEELVEETLAVRKKKRKNKWFGWVAIAACLAIVVAIARPLFPQNVSNEDEVGGTQSEVTLGDKEMYAHESQNEPLTEAPASEMPSETSEDTEVLGKPENTVLYDAAELLANRYIASAEYPEMVQCPNYGDYEHNEEAYYDKRIQWRESRNKILNMFEEPEREDYFDNFYQISSKQFLTNSKGENVVYSPSNVYMALAMLAELTDGESRQQILDLLGTESVEALRTEARYLWGTNYSDDGLLTTRMANSLWLDDDLTYNQGTMDLLAEEYFASSFSGEMGSEEYSATLRAWLNEQTNDLLKEQTEDIDLDPNTLMALASTIYFKGQWDTRFSKNSTKPAVFHGAKGDTTTDFMHQSDMGNVYWGESFTATRKPMEGGAAMWLILPDEGKTVDDVLAEGEIFEMTTTDGLWENSRAVMINLAVPKFDVSSKLDLTDGLKQLGVAEVFDPASADFSPMSEEIESGYISQAEHAARVMIDEEGCEAAAYTMMVYYGEAICKDEIDFVLDRPFIFVITGCGEDPLFIGVVNQVQ